MMFHSTTMASRVAPVEAPALGMPAASRPNPICSVMLGWLGRMYSQKQAAAKPTCGGG
jgi:hypothetical protein